MNKKQIKDQLAVEASSIVPNQCDQIREKIKLVKITYPKEDVISPVRKKMAPVLTFGLLLIILVFVLPFLLFPTNIVNSYSNTVITIDINPSIELEASPEGFIINVRGLNKDAILLLKGEEDKILNQELIKAIKEIIRLALEDKYLDSNDLLISAVNDNQTLEQKVLDKIVGELRSYLQTLQFKGQLTFVENTSKLKKEARNLGISAGKLNLIKKALAINPYLTIDYLKEKPIKEINNIIGNYSQDILDFETKYQELFVNLTKEAFSDFDEMETEFELTKSKINRINTVLKQLRKAKDKINQKQYQRLLDQIIDIYALLLELYPDDLVPISSEMDIEEIVQVLNDFQILTNSRLTLVIQNKVEKTRELNKSLKQKVKENIDEGLSDPFDIDIEDFLKDYFDKKS